MTTPQENKEQVIFKTKVFGGFEKEDVLSYISKIKEENDSKVVDLEENLKKMTEAGDILRCQIGTFEEKISLLENQLNEKGKRIDEMSGHIDSLKKEVSDSEEEKKELTGEIDSLKNENESLVKEVSDFREKAVQFDEMKVSIADILIDARREAEKVIESADREADKITGRAYAATGKVAEEMAKLKSDISGVRDNLVGLTDAFNDRLDEIEKVIDEIIYEKLPEPEKINSDLDREEKTKEEAEIKEVREEKPETAFKNPSYVEENMKETEEQFFRSSAR